MMTETEPVNKLICTQALARAYALALEKLPENTHGRLAKALTLVQQGQVFEADDGYFEVASQREGGEPYSLRVNGTCPCDWMHFHPGNRCTHMLAVLLQRKTMQLLTQARQAESSAVETPDEAPTVEAMPLALVPATTAPLTTTTDLAASLDAWTAQRVIITQFIQRHFRDGVDFYSLKIGGKETKPSLSKAGAEKFVGLFHLHATFHKDDETWEMLGRPAGVLCYRCELHTASGEVVGEGRGCRDVKKDSGDANKAIKMGEKSSLIDAVLRTGALSEVFTQDVEDLPENADGRQVRKAA
jgi:hypothetical protein